MQSPAEATERYKKIYGADVITCDASDSACMESYRSQICRRTTFTACMEKLCDSSGDELASLAATNRDACASAGHELFQLTTVHFKDVGFAAGAEPSAIAADLLVTQKGACATSAVGLAPSCYQTLRCSSVCTEAWGRLERILDGIHTRAAKVDVEIPRLTQ
jgi:hypothetical protein